MAPYAIEIKVYLLDQRMSESHAPNDLFGGPFWMGGLPLWSGKCWLALPIAKGAKTLSGIQSSENINKEDLITYVIS